MLKHLVVLAFGLSCTSSWAASRLIDFESKDVVPTTAEVPPHLHWLAEIAGAHVKEHAVVEGGVKKGPSRFDLEFRLRRPYRDGLEIRRLGLSLHEVATHGTVIAIGPPEDPEESPRCLYQLEINRALLHAGGDFVGSKACAKNPTTPAVLKVIPTDSQAEAVVRTAVPAPTKQPRRLSLLRKRRKASAPRKEPSLPGTDISGALPEFVVEFWMLSGEGIPKKSRKSPKAFPIQFVAGDEPTDDSEGSGKAYYINAEASGIPARKKHDPELREELYFQEAAAELMAATATIYEEYD